MYMQVYKSRANDLAGCVNDAIRRQRFIGANRFDRIAVDQHRAVGNDFMIAARPANDGATIDTYAHDNAPLTENFSNCVGLRFTRGSWPPTVLKVSADGAT